MILSRAFQWQYTEKEEEIQKTFLVEETGVPAENH